MTKPDSISYRISGELKTGGWCVTHMMHRGASQGQAEKKLQQIGRDHSGSINYTGKFRLERLTTFISAVKAVWKGFEVGYVCANCGDEEVDGLGEICKACEEYEKKCFARIDKLEAAGHSWHCARRQVYGDGECECRENDRMKERFALLVLQYTAGGASEVARNEARRVYQNDPIINRMVDCCVKIAIEGRYRW